MSFLLFVDERRTASATEEMDTEKEKEVKLSGSSRETPIPKQNLRTQFTQPAALRHSNSHTNNITAT